MRWETKAAAVMLVAFWVSSLWMLQTVRDGGRYWFLDDYWYTMPSWVLCPLLALSGKRHARPKSRSRTAAVCVLALWGLSPQTWVMFGHTLDLILR